MKTSELIDIILKNKLTGVEIYNLLTLNFPDTNVAKCQDIIKYFEYEIKEILVPVIDELKLQIK